MSELLPVSEAQKILLDAIPIVGEETIGFSQAAGRVLAEDVLANFDLPLFNNSTMDGFALRASDIAGANRQNPVSLDVVADIPAGLFYSETILPGQAARIMTGAPLPPGTDVVVPIEDTNFTRQQAGSPVPKQVLIYRSEQPGDYIRFKGKDARAQDVIIQRGTRVRPQEVGILAMLGRAQVRVYRRPRLAILPTGDELTPVGESLATGKIYESNSHALAAQIQQAGGETVPFDLLPDRLDIIQDAFVRASESGVDAILSTAGVSVGAHDFVRTVVEQDGRLVFWRVNMRPGKPLAFGFYRDIPFIGLPGNPVSAFASFEVFVRPALMKMGGEVDWKRIPFKAELLESVESDGRESYLRANVIFQEGRAYARLTGNQDSGNLRSLIQANALLIIPNEVKCLPIGAEVQAWLL